ncbi:MAG: MFS transporter [Planctomycetes bacterium]|nr:MFS transporter [Planctomycetota bacterium]
MERKGYFAGLSRNTYLLALASLFADVSTEMLYPILPIFLTQNLGATATVVGAVDGVAQAVQNVVQGFSGWLSDRLRRRKGIALVGYVLAAVAKPLIGLSTGWLGVLGARALDRLGAGTRSAPRDALVAASADEGSRGKAFGLEGAGDNLGAFLGPLITLALIALAAVSLPSIFLLAFVPGLLAALMVLLVREEPIEAHAKAKLDVHPGRFPKRYWAYLGVTALFGIGNSSNAFLILRTHDLGASLTQTILIYALFNLVAALASYPAGYLSDHLGRKNVLLASFVIFLVVYAGFGLTTDTALLGFLFAFYGLYQGVFRAVGKALASDLVPEEMRASGVGWYMATVGLTGLMASLVGGVLWTSVGPPATFCYGAGSALAGSVALLFFAPAGEPEKQPT